MSLSIDDNNNVQTEAIIGNVNVNKRAYVKILSLSLL